MTRFGTIIRNNAQLMLHTHLKIVTGKIYDKDERYIILHGYEGGNLAASKIRNLECPNYEICLIDYGCGKFNRKIHIMEQYP